MAKVQIYNNGPLTVQNSTFSGNSADTFGGGIENWSRLDLYNTLMANSPSGFDCVNAGGEIGVNDHNLIESDVDACGLTNGVNGNLIGVDPRLAALGNYGGATQTFALLPDSPAIDAGNPSSCQTTDQRGQARDDLQCDIGAYELKYADSHTVLRPVSSAITTTFGPALIGIQRDAGFTNPGTITVTKAAWSPKGPESIGAQWTITPGSTSGTFSLTLQLCYTNAELGSLTESALRFWRSDGLTWTQQITVPVLSIVNGLRCATISGVNALSRWTLAETIPTAITLNDLRATSPVEADRSWWLLLGLGVIGAALSLLRRRAYRA